VRIVVYPGDVRISGVSAELVIARSLRELRAVLDAEEPAALVIDLESGGHGALDVLRERRVRGSIVPVLALAPLGDAEAASRARALGSCAVLARESATSAVVSAALNELLELAPTAQADASRAPAMLFKTDPHAGFSHFTRRFLAYLGMTEPQARGRGWFERIHPEDRGEWLADLAAGLEQPGELSTDLRVRTAAGVYRWVRIAALSGFDAKGAFTGFVGSVFEIDDLVELRARAYTDVARLEAVSGELEELAFAGAHDLQEPLRSLEHALQGALAGEAADLTLALRQVSHMRELLRGLVDYAGSSALHVSVESTDLAQALEWALENLRTAIAECAAEIKLETLTRVVADPIQIARVFQNLVANALRFRGEERPIISVGAETRERDVLIYVRDNGIGIPAAHHETVFRVFERLHGGERPGTGMGLAICRRILERHGGRIWVESQPGRGAAFYFTLPRG
jgi:PAS domain S-box-containing protein